MYNMTTLPDTYNDMDSEGQKLKWADLHLGPGLLPAHGMPLQMNKDVQLQKAYSFFLAEQGTQLGKHSAGRVAGPGLTPLRSLLHEAQNAQPCVEDLARHVLTKD